MSIIHSAGHSNRPLSAFLGMLRKYETELLVDVRSLLRSRYNPHFSKDSFKSSLKENGIFETQRLIPGRKVSLWRVINNVPGSNTKGSFIRMEEFCKEDEYNGV